MPKHNKKIPKSDRPRSEPGFVSHPNPSRPSGVRPGFPRERTVTLPYVSITNMAAGTVTVASHQFIVNSCFDPDYTYAGHQPFGFDQWAQFYNHYVVEKVKVVLKPQIHYVSGSPNLLYGLYISDDATVSTSAMTLCEQGAEYAVGSQNANCRQLTMDIDVAKFFNRKNIAADNDLRASVLASPVDGLFLTLFVQDPQGTTAGDFNYALELQMQVRFMEPKDLGPSLLGRMKPSSRNGVEPGCMPEARLVSESTCEKVEYEYVRVKKADQE